MKAKTNRDESGSGRLVQSIDLSREQSRQISQISSLNEQDFVLEDLVM